MRKDKGCYFVLLWEQHVYFRWNCLELVDSFSWHIGTEHHVVLLLMVLCSIPT